MFGGEGMNVLLSSLATSTECSAIALVGACARQCVCVCVDAFLHSPLAGGFSMELISLDRNDIVPQ